MTGNIVGLFTPASPRTREKCIALQHHWAKEFFSSIVITCAYGLKHCFVAHDCTFVCVCIFLTLKETNQPGSAEKLYRA